MGFIPPGSLQADSFQLLVTAMITQPQQLRQCPSNWCNTNCHNRKFNKSNKINYEFDKSKAGPH